MYPQALYEMKALQNFAKIQEDFATFPFCVYLEQHLELVKTNTLLEHFPHVEKKSMSV